MHAVRSDRVTDHDPAPACYGRQIGETIVVRFAERVFTKEDAIARCADEVGVDAACADAGGEANVRERSVGRLSSVPERIHAAAFAVLALAPDRAVDAEF